MNSVRGCLRNIAKGTCVLQGHCPYADSIVESCMILPKTNWKDIVDGARKIVRMLDGYRCFCPNRDKCRTRKHVDEFLKTMGHLDV